MSVRDSATAHVPQPKTRAEFRTRDAEAEGKDSMVRILVLAMLIIAWAVAAIIVAGVIR